MSTVIGYVHGGTVRAEFMNSILRTYIHGGIDEVIGIESGPNISNARNLLVDTFLEEYVSPWLFMCDTDMTFESDTVQRLVEVAHPTEKPIVGGFCFSQNTGKTDARPTMYKLITSDNHPCFIPLSKWPESQCVRVDATGAACLLMHRDALEAIRKHADDRAAPWFREIAVGTTLMGEDLTFSLRCASAGIPIHVHTGIPVGHIKTITLIEGAYV